MMACDLSTSLGLSSSLKTQQGIVSILGDISSNTSSAPSLRRTFSADLSSKNWLLHNGFSPMKRISPSEKLRAFATDDEEAEEESRSGDDIWAQIQQDKNSEEEKARLGHTDVWTSILSEKKKTESVDPPYVHPLMKRASSLSEKSLNICTESLGSETGCESFSSSEIGDTEIENQEEINLVLNATETKVEEITESEIEVEHKSSITVPNHTIESFPPPIRSLSTQSGASLHMKTRRDNGRLVLEAISMPSHNNFSAKRQDGRLLLTFADEPNYEIDIGDETDSEIQPLDEEEEEETQTRDEFAYKPNGPITFHRLAHKPIRIPKSNTRWSATDEYTTKTNQSTPLVHSLPPRPRVAKPKPPSTVDDTVGAACFNTCNQFWKPNNTEAFGPNTKSRQDSWINGCKERRRSLLSVEPFCIAT